MKYIKLFESWERKKILNEENSKEEILSLLSSQTGSLENFYQTHQSLMRDIATYSKDPNFMQLLRQITSRLPGDYSAFRRQKEEERLSRESAEKQSVERREKESQIKKVSLLYPKRISLIIERLAKQVYNIDSLDPFLRKGVTDELERSIGGPGSLSEITKILRKISGEPIMSTEKMSKKKIEFMRLFVENEILNHVNKFKGIIIELDKEIKMAKSRFPVDAVLAEVEKNLGEYGITIEDLNLIQNFSSDAVSSPIFKKKYF